MIDLEKSRSTLNKRALYEVKLERGDRVKVELSVHIRRESDYEIISILKPKYHALMSEYLTPLARL